MQMSPESSLWLGKGCQLKQLKPNIAYLFSLKKIKDKRHFSGHYLRICSLFRNVDLGH